MRNETPPNFVPDLSCEDWTAVSGLQFPSMSEDNACAKQQLLLERIIADKVVPRLLLANFPAVTETVATTDATAATISATVGELAELVIKRDAGASIAYFAELRSRGATLESLFQDLLAPVARRLGELWEEDINDFLDVTRGVSHLQQIVHTFSDELISEGRRPASNRRALLMPMPGEQHTFGVSLIAEQFRREGWRVWSGPPRVLDDIMEVAASQWFDMIGLSISAISDPAAVAASIQTIRTHALNKAVKVLVGGHGFATQPELVSIIGADATARDGREALLQITNLIGPAAKCI